MPEPVIYDFGGKRYSSGIHDDAVLVHKHGEGRDLTNQQACTVILADGTWMTCWTQATEEAAKDESTVFSVSRDGGATWSQARFIEEAEEERTASWGMLFAVPPTGPRDFPAGETLQGPTGRVYCFYWWNENAFWLRDAGSLYFRFTDDRGDTWSERRRISVPRHRLDEGGKEQHGWNTGFPILTPDGSMLMGFSKINEDSMYKERPGYSYGNPDLWWSEVFFLRCPNILLESDPDKLVFQVTPQGDEGLWAPHNDEPARHFLQEPYMAVLPSGRILATMRSRTGHPCYSVSEDCGVTWSPAQDMRFLPGGEKMKHPCGPCTVTCTSDGRIIFFFRNDNAPIEGDNLAYWANRDPIHVTVGREMPLLAMNLQPEESNAGLCFGQPRVILSGLTLPDTEPNPKRKAEYPQIIEWADRYYVSYSSQKTDLYIKEIPPEMISGWGLP